MRGAIERYMSISEGIRRGLPPHISVGETPCQPVKERENEKSRYSSQSSKQRGLRSKPNEPIEDHTQLYMYNTCHLQFNRDTAIVDWPFKMSAAVTRHLIRHIQTQLNPRKLMIVKKHSDIFVGLCISAGVRMSTSPLTHSFSAFVQPLSYPLL